MAGGQTKEVGGGPAVGLAGNWVNALQSLLNMGGTGSAGSPDAFGTTGGIMGILSELLSPGAGRVGGAIEQRLTKQSERDVAGIRARYGAGGGVGLGTPAAFGEAIYRGEAAPRITEAISGLQLAAMAPLLQSIHGLSGLGIPQRQTIQEQSTLGKIAGTLGPIAGAALPFLTPAFSQGAFSPLPGSTYMPPSAYNGIEIPGAYLPPVRF